MIKLLTKGFTKIPLLWVDFNLKKYKKYGAKNSCTAMLHPTLKSDVLLQEKINDIIDYIRDNYDMDELTK